MNKRQRKKHDKKLFQAIRELNEEVAKDLEIEHELGTEEFEESLLDAFKRVKEYRSENKVFKAHKRMMKEQTP